MPILSIAIQKGGSGKTTTALNLAAALQQLGQEVLLIDMDPQANLTQSLGIRVEPEPNIYHLLKQAAMGQPPEVTNALLEVGELQLIPAALELANAELELVSVYGREKLLERILKSLQKAFDYIIIDCPPAIGMLTVNALASSDYVLMPLQAEFLPMKGIQSFMRTIQMVKGQINSRLEVLGYLLTKYDGRKSMNRNVLEQLTTDFGKQVFETKIRTNIALAHAQEWGSDIFQHDRSSKGAFDYMQLAQEVLARVNHA